MANCNFLQLSSYSMYWQREACDALQERGETDTNTELVKVSGHPL